ncbi:MAG: MG2 domain-containing protein [Defluviitaleaceae bacterium]|nr:MG2 domain-containing protein [Defluviitaleaceae bacterium]MCL2240180.1 MG2 domain-containing protein [Defluviitaleaceae bacterium]
MKRRNTNGWLYILAAIVFLASAHYVYSRVRNFIEARQEQAEEPVFAGPLHELTLMTNQRYFLGMDMVASVQVRDLQGSPVQADLTVSLYNGEEHRFKTDALGHSLVSFPLPEAWSGPRELVIAVDSGLGAEVFQWGIHLAQDDEPYFIIHFDKGLYNPGDDVLFRILALARASARPLGDGMYTVSIFDGNDNRVFFENARTSDFGIISGRFSLGEEVNSGVYRLVVAQGGRELAHDFFEVRPFVLPRFDVTLTTDRAEYRVGETLGLTGLVMYFFGEPVNQGRVNVYINDAPVLVNGELDEYGGFSVAYTTANPGMHRIWVEVIDNSNYRVETVKTVGVSEGAFLIEVMPEHGYLLMDMPNTVYVFTHNLDGAPVRTFMQITGRGFSRQVATCENGIGMFVLEDVQTRNDIFIHAVDGEDNAIQQEFVFPGISRNIAFSTNRPRFAMGEAIELTLHRQGQGGVFMIYVYRNDRLLEMIQTEHDRVELHLGDAFGLIDIYAAWLRPGQSDIRDGQTFARRTVFIDPGKAMRLTVESDREEYKPGEFVHLRFGVTDGAGRPLDAALLVNVVDEAMLAVAANDLSIDNIRLALADIRFGDDLDAATLYASLIAGASEQAITRLLLRQEDAAPFLQASRLMNHPPPPPGWRWEDFNPLPTIFNMLRLYTIIGASVAFFLILRAQKKSFPLPPASPYEAMGYVPNAPAPVRSRAIGRKRAKWVVIFSLLMFVLAFIFLASCGRGADDVAHAPAPAPATTPAPMPMPAPPPPAAPAPAVAAEPDMPAPTPEIETQTARVRRLFLETMLFVPELIARDGHADLSFMLADNITTWNIQVVGNTLEGILGHTQGSIRAFQPFFVDFELPRNAIRYDRVSIPVTVFNYTEYEQTVVLTIAELDWFDLHVPAEQVLVVPSNRSQMVYVPITITRFGDFVFRAYADADGFADAAERGLRVNPEGFRIRQVVSSGSLTESTRQHLLFMHPHIPDTRRATITFYPSVMSTVLEGMENIFRMPFGCFEQTSSILYPNVLALRYLQENNLDNPALTERALRYISSGYQRLLTFEVGRGSGGFSLFGHAPAETLLTAYGLMQLKDLSGVYAIDERVLERMKDFLFRHQNSDGTFDITGGSHARMPDSQRLAFNAYITWALSAAFPGDTRLHISLTYLLSRLDVVDDNYTLALIANALVNTGHPRAQEVINRLAEGIRFTGDAAYVTSTTRDYFGAFGRIQYLQATALASLAFSGSGLHGDANDLLISYIISQRDSWGTWHSTQATILSLKALTRHASAAPLADGYITVTLSGQRHVIPIRSENTLDLYQITFTGLERENILYIDFPDLGRMTYKIVLEYFAPYDSVVLDRGFEVSARMNTHLAVHEWVDQEIRIINTSGHIVKNGLVTLSIPQGFRVERGSLTLMQHAGIIQRYEFRHDNINLYLRDTQPGEIIDLVVSYRPAFPVEVIGGHVRVFDYYNPTIEGFLMPMAIAVA